MYKKVYKSPIGNIFMRSDGEYLTGLWFENSRDTSKHSFDFEEKDLPIFDETIKWLEIYFSGIEPDFTPKYRIENLTPFRKQVIDIINTIPYGKTINPSICRCFELRVEIEVFLLIVLCTESICLFLSISFLFSSAIFFCKSAISFSNRFI